MKKLWIGLAILLSMCGYSYGADLANCEQSTVQTALTNASRGDTITLPACDVVWNSKVSYTKALTIKGSGSSTTIIRAGSGFSAGNDYLLSFNSSTPASDASYTNEVSGITFDLNGKALGPLFRNYSTTTNLPILTVKFTDNIIQETYGGSLATCDPSTPSLYVYGAWKGVIANNTIRGDLPYIWLDGMRNIAFNNDEHNVVHGTDNAIYFEDNTVISEGTNNNTCYFLFLVTNNNGIQVVNRYNEYRVTQSGKWKVTYPWSPHHPRSPNDWGGKGGEFYGNYMRATNSDIEDWAFASPRSGKSLIFNNRILESNGKVIWNQYPWLASQNPTYYPPGATDYPCGSDTLFNGDDYCDATGQPQHIWKSYQWSNYYGTSEQTVVPTSTTGASYGLRENIHYFNYNTSCTASSCSSGVGCGSSTPTGTCTTGTAYWKTSQSCSDLTDMYGVNPTTPISGTLYRCNSTNNWGIYYVPYTYPHPLRDNPPEDTDPPSISNRSPSNGSTVACTVESEPYAEDVAISFTATDQTQASVVCKWDTTVDDTPTYAELSNTFSASGTTFSDTATGIPCGTGATIYYACTDETNTNDVASWSFNVESHAGETPTITNLSVTNQSCAVTNLLKVGTQVPSSCRYCVNGVSGCASDTAWASRTPFTVSGGDTVHHEVSISQSCSSSATYNVTCQDAQQNESSNLAVTITTDAAKGVALGTGSLGVAVGSGNLTITIIQ